MSAVEQVLVIPTELFHEVGHFQGVCGEVGPYLERLFDPAQISYRPRDEMEQDPRFKQLIPYCLFRHGDHLFQYTRGKLQGVGRRGVAVGAVRLMLSHLSRLHLADLALAYVDTRNAASIAVLARLGFSRVRTIEGADYFKNTVSDEYEYLRTMSLPPAG